MTRSDRTTGRYRKRKGSGCVGRIPNSKPGNPYKERRKTKPLCVGKHTTGAWHESVIRGRRKQLALIARAFERRVRPNRVAAAVRNALTGRAA